MERCLRSRRIGRTIPSRRNEGNKKVPFPGTSVYCCQLSIFMKDELTRPLRVHPFSTRKGGDLFSDYLFPHMCLERIVQKNPSCTIVSRRNVDNHQNNTGHHLSWDGKVPVRADRSYNLFPAKLGNKKYLSLAAPLLYRHYRFLTKMNLPGRSGTLSALEGSDRQNAYLFPHMCLACVVRDFILQRPLSRAGVLWGEPAFSDRVIYPGNVQSVILLCAFKRFADSSLWKTDHLR